MKWIFFAHFCPNSVSFFFVFPFDVKNCLKFPSVITCIKKKLWIHLRLSERLTFRDVQSPQEFRHGETAEVVCDVISSPVPVVVWYYQDKEITAEHHSRFSRPFGETFFCTLIILLMTDTLTFEINK